MSVLLCLAGFFSFNRNVKSEAYNASNEPTTVIDNLYNNDGSWNRNNLLKLANAVNYDTFLDMESAIKNGSDGIKKASDFANTTVKLGSYTTKQGSVAELEWIPVYLSKDDNGNAILTLWLSSSEDANTSSDQEISSFSDGTIGSNVVRTWSENGNTYNVYCTTYDSSYIRQAIFNLDSNYAGNFGQSVTSSGVVNNNTGHRNPPNFSTYNKFEMFQTGGSLTDYLVAPKNIAWQFTETGYYNAALDRKSVV